MTAKNTVYRVLSFSNDVRAASRGPAPFARRVARKHAYRGLARLLRRVGLSGR